MKLKLSFILLLFLSIKGFGQDATKVFDEVKNVTIRNTGVIKKNNVVKGYYNFYEFDKIDRKTRLFRLNLLDENLNNVGTKDIAGPKDWELISSGYDGNYFGFKFWDEKTKSFDIKVYDQDANEVASNTLKINYNINGTKPHEFGEVVSSELNILENGGFVNYTFNDPNNAFIISYADGATKSSWQYTYKPEGKSKVMVPTFLNGNNELTLTSVTRIDRGMYTTSTENSLLANNVKDGSQLFDISTEFGDNHVVPINAVFENNKILIVGLNYKKAKTYTTAPDGFAFVEVDKSGKVLKTNFKTFEESLGKFLPIENHQLKDGYNLFIHDIVRTDHNTYVVIAEKFKKAADAGGIALSLVSSSAGAIKLQLENMVVIEYDSDGNALQAREIPKAKGNTGTFPSYTGLLSSYFLANAAKFLGEMDFMYTTKNDDNSEITFSFVDYDRLSSDAKKTENFGQIRYKNGVFNVDKIAIKNEKATLTHLYPAKTNHVMQMNYFKKDKKLEMDMIKLNN